nr:hypothetical protein CJLB15_00113 [Campylobacter phage CJLB-15]
MLVLLFMLLYLLLSYYSYCIQVNYLCVYSFKRI